MARPHLPPDYLKMGSKHYLTNRELAKKFPIDLCRDKTCRDHAQGQHGVEQFGTVTVMPTR